MISTLKHYLLLQRPDTMRRNDGSITTVFRDVCHVYADICPMGPKESYYAMGLHMKLTHRIRMRYREGLLPGMRFLYQSRVFHVRSVMNIQEDNRFLSLLCEEEQR